MPHPSKRPHQPAGIPQGSVIAMLAERSQLDFELAFFQAILDKVPDFAEVLQAHAGNLTTKGLMKEGLKVDQKLVEIRAHDPMMHYQLACRYAALKQADMAINTLRKAVELGYRDFRTMIHEREFATLRKDRRFIELLKEYGEL